MSDYKKAAESLRLALPLMAEKKVSANPVNYAVFYEYVSKTNELLNSELDNLMANNDSLSNELCQELYEKKLVAFELETLRKMQFGLRNIVDTLLTTLKNVDDGTESFVQTLDGISGDLTQDVEADKLLSIVNQLSQETKQVRERHTQFKSNVEENQKEVVALRQELEKVRQEATTDALTGLLNRKSLDGIMQDAFAQQKGEQTGLSMLIVDIDKFKRINDNYGHLVGDKVIRYIAHTIKTNVPPHAKVFRFGGEEFVVLLPHTCMSVAAEVAETIRQAQEKGKLITTSSNDTIGQVTVSIGVTSFSLSDSQETFIDRADKALYKAKTDGRNCVVQMPALVSLGKVLAEA